MAYSKMQHTDKDATYRFRDIGLVAVEWPKFSPYPNFGLVGSKRGENLCATDIYHRAKFHTDRCRRRQYICNRTVRT